jgi:molybdopterin/thiamine biosynthesis adenylyltransferase
MGAVLTDTMASGIAQSPEQNGDCSLPGVPERSHTRKASWSYEEAFKRNRGLISEEEQEKLRNSRVAIAGMGGVGGVHLVTLARMGIGKFTIADPDVFEVANFNRQYGATVSNLGRTKAEAMAEMALDINPELQLKVMPHAIDEPNVDEFLDGADLLLDGLDFFEINVRRLIFKRAAAKGIWAITSGPVGFGAAWLNFNPNGMSFDKYFDLRDGMDHLDQLIAFAVGLTPRATQFQYMDLKQVTVEGRTAPSVSLACTLATGVLATEAMKILLRRPWLTAAPEFMQFDSYRRVLRSGRIRSGNRSVSQRVKRRVLKWSYLAKQASRK